MCMIYVTLTMFKILCFTLCMRAFLSKYSHSTQLHELTFSICCIKNINHPVALLHVVEIIAFMFLNIRQIQFILYEQRTISN